MKPVPACDVNAAFSVSCGTPPQVADARARVAAEGRELVRLLADEPLAHGVLPRSGRWRTSLVVRALYASGASSQSAVSVVTSSAGKSSSATKSSSSGRSGRTLAVLTLSVVSFTIMCMSGTLVPGGRYQPTG